MRSLSFSSIVLLLILTANFAHSQAQATTSRCQEERDSGDTFCGQNPVTRFYFDHRTKRCQPFLYQGCAGNQNRFNNRTECEAACSSVGSSVLVYERKVCSNGIYAAVDTQGVALDCNSCPNGFSCENSMCCGSRAAVCTQNYDAGRFGSGGRMTPRYFYSQIYKNCMFFTYYGLAGNSNNFGTYSECQRLNNELSQQFFRFCMT